MDTLLASRIKKKLQKELIKRKLVEYFASKGYDNFGGPLYPPSCFDLPIKVPQLFSRVEIIPSVEETDTTLGTVKLSWSLFVLGTNRIHLGYTTHTGESDVVRAVMGAPDWQLPAEFTTSPKDVIKFILKVLSNSKKGFVDLPDHFQIPPGALTDPLMSKARNPRVGPSSSGAFYAH